MHVSCVCVSVCVLLCVCVVCVVCLCVCLCAHVDMLDKANTHWTFIAHYTLTTKQHTLKNAISLTLPSKLGTMHLSLSIRQLQTCSASLMDSSKELTQLAGLCAFKT